MRIESPIHPGALFKAAVFLGAMAAIAAPQNRPAAIPEPHGQDQVQVQAAPSPSPSPLPQDANQYVRQALEHELAEQDGDHSHWRYHFHREDERNNYDRDVIESSEGQLARTLLKWGRPLSAEERAEDEQRMRRLVNDPAERARHAKREKEDGEKARQMLRSIPDAFIFKYAGEDDGLVRLTFVPNPRFRAPSLELSIFRSLNGTLWIHRAAGRLARIDGTLFEDVNIGWGLLGHLNKGGTFKVVQQDVGQNHWDVVSEEVNMVGRAIIFKTITRRQKQTLSDFRRVPDSLTISQAYQMLQKDPSPVSASNPNSASLDPLPKQ